MTNIAIFGSGSGTNAENIINFFKNNQKVTTALLVSNSEKSRFKIIAEKNAIPFNLFENAIFEKNPDALINSLKNHKIDFIILAGFLRKIHPNLIQAYSNKIINIHPSLLPKYGGPGMYGMKVHEAVLSNEESESGITVHFVNENFDEGEIIVQKKIDVSRCINAEQIREKVQELEQLYFPEIINLIL